MAGTPPLARHAARALILITGLTATQVGHADDSCRWANDGECDVPQYCDAGTDDTDCENTPEPGTPDSCRYANDGECDEPNLCDVGTDTTDCRNAELAAEAAEAGDGDDSCVHANDGECDVPPVCELGTDRSDCSGGTQAGPNSCRYANDGECDEPNLCDAGTDTADCTGSGGPDSCRYANDGECDEPNLCNAGTDTTDCSNAGGPNSCRWANDGECDEPTICNAGTDTADCRGDLPDFGGGTLGRVLGGLAAAAQTPQQALERANSCRYANDGECDEPGLCSPGTDSTDCGTMPATVPDPVATDARGPNSCSLALDGHCDEPSACAAGTDSDDCSVLPVLFNRGTNATGQAYGLHPGAWALGLVGLLLATLGLSTLARAFWRRRTPNRRVVPAALTEQFPLQSDDGLHARAAARLDVLVADLTAAAEAQAMPVHISRSPAGTAPLWVELSHPPSADRTRQPGTLRITLLPKQNRRFDLTFDIEQLAPAGTVRLSKVISVQTPECTAIVAALGSGQPLRLPRARRWPWQVWRARNSMMGLNRVRGLRLAGLALLSVGLIVGGLFWHRHALTTVWSWGAALALMAGLACLVSHTVLRRRAGSPQWLTDGRPDLQPMTAPAHAHSGQRVLLGAAARAADVLEQLRNQCRGFAAQGIQANDVDSGMQLQTGLAQGAANITVIGNDLLLQWHAGGRPRWQAIRGPQGMRNGTNGRSWWQVLDWRIETIDPDTNPAAHQEAQQLATLLQAHVDALAAG